jgi:hypothetical protein
MPTTKDDGRRDAVDLAAFAAVLGDLRAACDDAMPGALPLPAGAAHVQTRLLIECLRRLPPAEVAWAVGRVAHDLGLVEADALLAMVAAHEGRFALAAGVDHGD